MKTKLFCIGLCLAGVFLFANTSLEARHHHRGNRVEVGIRAGVCQDRCLVRECYPVQPVVVQPVVPTYYAPVYVNPVRRVYCQEVYVRPARPTFSTNFSFSWLFR